MNILDCLMVFLALLVIGLGTYHQVTFNKTRIAEAQEPAVLHVEYYAVDPVCSQLATDLVIPAGTIAYRLNNPFNLKYMGQVGAERDRSNFARFGTLREGIQAGLNQIRLDAGRWHTLESFIYKYAPPEENNTEAYLWFLVQETGASWQDQLCTIDEYKLAKALMKYECGANWQQL